MGGWDGWWVWGSAVTKDCHTPCQCSEVLLFESLHFEVLYMVWFQAQLMAISFHVISFFPQRLTVYKLYNTAQDL